MVYLTLKSGQAIQVCSTDLASGILCLWLGGLNMKLSLTVQGGYPVPHPDFSIHIQFCFSVTWFVCIAPAMLEQSVDQVGFKLGDLPLATKCWIKCATVATFNTFTPHTVWVKWVKRGPDLTINSYALLCPTFLPLSIKAAASNGIKTPLIYITDSIFILSNLFILICWWKKLRWSLSYKQWSRKWWLQTKDLPRSGKRIPQFNSLPYLI